VGLAAVVGFAPTLLPTGTFRVTSGLPAVIALRGLVAAAGFGAEVFLPLMLTRERGLTPAFAGLVLTVSALSWTAASWYRGRPEQPFSHAVFLQAGMVSIMLGITAAALTLNPAVPVLVGILGRPPHPTSLSQRQRRREASPAAGSLTPVAIGGYRSRVICGAKRETGESPVRPRHCERAGCS
jgi:hypothetical protein